MGGGYDFGALGVLAVIGAVSVLVVGVPGAGAAIALLAWRIVSADWSPTAMLVGGGIGALPAIALGLGMLWVWIKGD